MYVSGITVAVTGYDKEAKTDMIRFRTFWPFCELNSFLFLNGSCGEFLSNIHLKVKLVHCLQFL